MTLYRSYTQPRDYNPIKVPMDEAEKIRKQGLRALSQMQENYEFERQQAREFADAFNSNAKLEQKLFDQNTRDQKEYGEIIHKAQLQNLQVSIDDAKRKSARGDQTLNNLKAIASFAQTAGDAYMKVEGQRRKNIDNFLTDSIINYGLTFKELQTLKNAEGSLIDSETELSGVLKDLESRGVPLDVLNRLAGASGYLRYAMNKEQAMMKANGYDAWLATQANETILINGVEHTLTSALQNPEVLPTVLGKLRTKYLQDEDGNPYFKNKVLASSGASAQFRSVDAAWMQRSTQKLTAGYQKDQNQAILTLINERTGNAGNDTQEIIGAKGLFEAVRIRAGKPPGPDATPKERAAYKEKRKAAMREVEEATIKGLKSGAIRWERVKDLDKVMVGPGTGIDVPGLKGGKPVLAQRHFRRFVNNILDAHEDARVRSERDAERELTNVYAQGNNLLRDVRKYINSGERNANMIRALTTKALELAQGDPNHPATKAVQELQRSHAYHRTNANDQSSLAYLRSRAEKGYLPTVAEIEKFNLSDAAHKEALQIRQSIKNLVPTEGENGTRKRIEFRVQGALENIVKKKIKDSMSRTWKDQEIFATEQVNRWYMSYLQQPGKSGDHEGAYNYAIGQLEAIAKPGSDHPDWETTSVDGQYEFKRALIEKQDNVVIGREAIARELNADPGLIFKKLYFDPNALKSFSSQVNRGRSPTLLNRATLIESLTEGRVLAVDAIQANLQMLRNKEIAETGASDIQLLPDSYIKQQRDIQHWMGPTECHLAESWDLVDINKACMSQKEDGTIGNPAYISQIIGKKAQLEARVEDYKAEAEVYKLEYQDSQMEKFGDPERMKDDGVQRLSLAEWEQLKRYTEFVEGGESKTPIYQGTGTPWRDPLFLNTEAFRLLLEMPDSPFGDLGLVEALTNE